MPDEEMSSFFYPVTSAPGLVALRALSARPRARQPGDARRYHNTHMHSRWPVGTAMHLMAGRSATVALTAMPPYPHGRQGS